ncbi:hypothetical protein Tco_1192361 [Tanacetum coccineum]
MTSITAEQTKLDLELVPKENRLTIGMQWRSLVYETKEETFQVVLDALTLTPCYHAFLITADVPEVYMYQFWICIYKHDDIYRFKIDKKKRFKLTLEVFRVSLDFPKSTCRDFDARPLFEEDNIYFLRDLVSLGFVSRREASQKYGDVLPECLTSPEMKESKAYKTYLSYATGAVPPKSKQKEKGKCNVAHGKGIELLSDVALTEEAQIKEVKKKSLRDFHKTHPSGFGTVAEDPPRVAMITPIITSEGTGDKPGVPNVTNDESTESESKSWGNDEDDNNNE